uniref:Dienelactone hydrolase family protein n=1 Tax=Streptomyces sp. NBC_01401 TaxID=2903854 RepID=A0AAU3H5C7_9ACTN
MPDFFFRQGPTARPDRESAFARRELLDEELTVRDLDAAVQWLRMETGSARVRSLDFCMGGTFALDLASLRDDMVTVSYYGFPLMPPPKPMDLVDELRGPVLAFWGEDDRGIGPDTVHAYTARASKANPGFTGEVIPGLGHGFLAAARIDDAADAGGATWQRTLTHFADHLGRSSGQDAPS